MYLLSSNLHLVSVFVSNPYYHIMDEDSVLSEQRTLCVAQYWRGYDSNGQRMPLHWALFAISNASPDSLRATSSGKEQADQVDHWGTCYQAVGNIDTFTYSCMEDECMEILAEGYRGCLVVGKIDSFSAEEINTLLQQVTVYRGRENWNCQNWVLAALERLKSCNYVASCVSRDAVRSELEDILHDWIE
ncbi:uncharacterized protein EDB91DRAFT_72056 [Suillus paluster]|uniref:uncharacterized protein n=1 Tax=Suillus paluster TaxID=48578 RepID=UPI001B885BF7|nr:uncharacterized protein EDB91DRAFT_72056 [Suillus paluster]KAG1747152.1 hypothetical protein EDB91DRAFT_72056 [Suillus paluster]